MHGDSLGLDEEARGQLFLDYLGVRYVFTEGLQRIEVSPAFCLRGQENPATSLIAVAVRLPH